MTLGWTRGGRLETIVKGWTTVTYGYDVYGKRTAKMIDGVQTKYLYEEGKLIKEYTDTDYIYYIYGKDGIIGIKTKDKSYMFRKNIFGDVEEIYDENGNLVGKYGYTAFGKCSIELDMDGIATINHIRYRSYYYDTETELYYLNTRYYDPETGRFIGIDNVKYADPNTINGLNLYAYCGNNPVMFTDPNGTTKWWEWVLAAVIIIGAIALSVATMGLATPISAAVGGGLAGAIIGGAVAGAISGAVASFGISVASQGVINGFSNIDWQQVGQSTLTGVATGALFGAISGGVSYYFSNTTALYRAVSADELTSIKSSGGFSLKFGAFEGKQFGLTLKEVRSYANLPLNNGVYSAIVKTRVPNSVFNQFFRTATDTFAFKSGIVTVGEMQMNLLNSAILYLKYLKL